MDQFSKAVQVGTRRVRSDPDERHSNVVVTKGSIKNVLRVLLRGTIRLFLHTPLLALRVEGGVNMYGIQFINEIMRSFIRRALGLICRQLLSARRPNGPFRVIKGVRDVIPNAAFIGSKIQLGILSLPQIRGDVRFAIERSEARDAMLLAMVVLMTRQAFIRRANVLLLTGHDNCTQRDVINGVMFRNV